MSSSDGGSWILGLLTICGLIMLLVWLGGAASNTRWENMLVDEPNTISAIRSRVLAERTEQATK